MAIETILDQPDYNIFTDPELATRSPEFLQEYISNLKPDDYSSLLELDYGKHGNILTNEDYRKAMLADEELYRDYNLTDVITHRTVNTNSTGGGAVYELTHGGGGNITIDIAGKTYSLDQIASGLNLTAEETKAMVKAASNYKGVEWITQLNDILSKKGSYKDFFGIDKDLIVDKTTGKEVKLDDTLRESYFAKAAEVAGGVKGLYERGDADFKKSVEEAMVGTTKYEDFMANVAKSGTEMMKQYEDLLSQADTMYTNTLDTKKWTGLLEDDDTYIRGIY